MKERFFGIALFASLVFGLASAASARTLNGQLFVKDKRGSVHVVSATLKTSQEDVTLQVGDVTLTSSVAQTATSQNGQTLLGAVFMNLPKSTGKTALIMRGLITTQGDINGDFYVSTDIIDDSPVALSHVLARVLSEDIPSGLTYESAFHFSPLASSASSHEQIFVGRVGGRLIYSRLIYASNDPTRIVGCWTNAGVGRNAEYYSGDCPNRGAYSWEAAANGQVMTAAGFERGVPYSWTRQGQLQALLVGVERTRAFNEVYLAYSRPNFYGWGFFYLFPWQIMR